MEVEGDLRMQEIQGSGREGEVQRIKTQCESAPMAHSECVHCIIDHKCAP